MSINAAAAAAAAPHAVRTATILNRPNAGVPTAGDVKAFLAKYMHP